MSVVPFELIAKELKALLEETFVVHHGIYTDKGTSLSQTLGTIDHVRASTKIQGHKETIAGHVAHTTFYVRVLHEYILGVRNGPVDWNESWTTTVVTKDEWEAVKAQLFAEYEKLMKFIDTQAAWDKEDHLGGVMAVVAHCAYHLGAIRQLKEV